jgi:aminopeptidase-like protein
MYGTYPEYHTSADNRNFISFDAMEESIKKYLEIIELLERNDKYLNMFPYGEPQLGKRGLYPTLGSQKNRNQYVNAIMWILNLSDGEHDLIDISEKSKIPVKDLYAAIESLLEKEVISAVGS